MSWISVDIEADGPIPGKYSMVSFGAVLVSDPSKTFYAEICPISEEWDSDALAVSGFSREQTLEFPGPWIAMARFAAWLKEHNGNIMAADNNGFDWQFINYYFHMYVGSNPFGFSSRNINDIYHGLVKDARASFKHLRKTKHTHNPVDDAMGNVEALIYMRDTMGFKVKF